MIHRNLIRYAFAAMVVFTACTKSEISTPPSSLAASSESFDQSVQRGNRNFELLTAGTWKFSKYYINYKDSSDPGKLIYKEGSSSNYSDFSKSRLTYLTNGVVTNVDSTGASTSGTWHFSNADSTQVTETYGRHDVVRTLVFLTKKSYRWYDDARHTAYAEMKPDK